MTTTAAPAGSPGCRGGRRLDGAPPSGGRGAHATSVDVVKLLKDNDIVKDEKSERNGGRERAG